MSIWLEMV